MWIRKKLFYLTDSQYYKNNEMQKCCITGEENQGIIKQPILLKINGKDGRKSGERQWHLLLYGHASHWLNLFKQNLSLSAGKIQMNLQKYPCNHSKH